MKLKIGDRQWIEVEKEDGSTTKFMVLGIDRGRLHLSAEGLTVRPDGETMVILEASE